MKGDTCGFLHQFDPSRMPVCRTMLKFGACKEPDCPYKHSLEEIKECNMYKLGFCIYGPAVRLLGLETEPVQVGCFTSAAPECFTCGLCAWAFVPRAQMAR